MTKKRIHLFLSIALLICNVIGIAQNNQLRNYTLADGLPQSQVYTIAQDSIGYLWLGTQGGGLARFDGRNFTVTTESDGLASNYINTLLSKKDTLFIGTKRGLNIKTKDTLFTLKSPQVNTLYHDGNRLLVGTDTGIFILYNNELTPASNKKLNKKVVRDIHFDGSNYWIASTDGLFTTRSLHRKSPVNTYDTSDFSVIHQYNNILLAATFSEGVIAIDINTKSEDVFFQNLRRINDIQTIHNQLWIATDTGITIVDPVTFQKVKTINRRNGLSVSQIRKVINDRQGNTWIATSGGGFYRYSPNDFTHFDKDTGLQGNRIYAVHNAGKEIYISNSEAGLTRIDSLGIHPLIITNEFENVKIKTITTDEKGNLWAGSDGKGLLLRERILKDSLVFRGDDIYNIDIDTVKVPATKERVFNEVTGFVSNWIRGIVAHDKALWIATYAEGIVKMAYNNEVNQYMTLKIYDKADGIEDLLIKTITKDDEGAIWYATQKGHLGYIKDNYVTHLGAVLKTETAINNITFNDTHIFLGTAGKGIWIGKKAAKPAFLKLAGNKTLTSQNCYQLIFDNQNNLWAGNERGVDKILLDVNHEISDLIHYGRNDGFLGIETCLNAVDIDHKGNLWLGALYGLTKYETSIPKNTTDIKPTISFEKVEVDFKNTNQLPATNWINRGKTLYLFPEQDQISFYYRTVDLTHPKEVMYRSKLDKGKWSPWSTTPEQNLLGLGYGNHTFKVQSRNYRWQESDIISYPFFIETPLYKKTWFLILFFSTLLLLIVFFVWRYIKGIKLKNKKATEQLQLENHLLSLEQKALRLQMNPHFIFNVLNGIKAMGTNNPQKMETTINTFATMLREILYNSRKTEIGLDQEIKTLKKYIEVEQLMTRTPFEYTLDVESDIDPEEILIPPMLVQPFVENAIQHGISKRGDTKNIGKVAILFKTDETFLHCTIIDNGPGIFQSQKNKKKTDHQSVALDVTKERIVSLGGKDALQLRELQENDVVLGTQIQFKIPLETDF